MPNIKQIINTHNNAVIKKERSLQQHNQTECNCRRDDTCPLNGKCLTAGIVYQTTVTRQDNQHEETYIGLTENTFKTRFNGHTSTFRSEEKKNSTTLSRYVWTLKERKVPFSINWKIVTKAKPFKPPILFSEIR